MDSNPLLVIILITLYFIPIVVATLTQKRNASAIFLLNLFLGWTFVGWVVALVWACAKDRD